MSIEVKDLKPGMKFEYKGAVYTFDWYSIAGFDYDVWYDSHKDYVTYKGILQLHVKERTRPIKIEIHEHIENYGDAPTDRDSVEHMVRGFAPETILYDIHEVQITKTQEESEKKVQAWIDEGTTIRCLIAELTKHIAYVPATKDKLGYLKFIPDGCKHSHLTPEEEELIKKYF